jgi:hypothetical protein
VLIILQIFFLDRYLKFSWSHRAASRTAKLELNSYNGEAADNLTSKIGFVLGSFF